MSNENESVPKFNETVKHIKLQCSGLSVVAEC